MRRRDFIKGIVGSATAWPLTTRAQQRELKRRVAILMGGLLPGDFGGQAEAAALEAGLTELGWKLGGNIELEYGCPGGLEGLAVIQSRDCTLRGGLSPISGGGGPSTRHDRCFCPLRQCGPYRKCV